jgi:hypothetical protein
MQTQANDAAEVDREIRDLEAKLKALQAKHDSYVGPFLKWLEHGPANSDALKKLTFTDPKGTDPADCKTLKRFESHCQKFKLKSNKPLAISGFERYRRFLWLQFSVIP